MYKQAVLGVAAFVLGVPIFALLTEYIGYRTGEKRYDKLAHDFTKLLAASFSTTASFGGLLAFSLFALYPTFMSRLSEIFSPTYALYGLLFLAEAFAMYFYCFSCLFIPFDGLFQTIDKFCPC